MSEWNAETAEWYAHKYGEHPTNLLAVRCLELDADAIIVDIGCGTGAALRHAAEFVTNGTLIGVDPVQRMVESARERTADHPAASRIEFRKGAAERLSIDDNSADVIFAFDSFDHWQDGASGLAEAYRVLKPQGQFVVVKDDGVPGAGDARRAFAEACSLAGFVVLIEQHVEGDDVSFTMWSLGKRGSEGRSDRGSDRTSL